MADYLAKARALALPTCNACPYADNGKPRHWPVLGEVPKTGTKCRGVLVGEGPGNDEVAEGRPFVGRTGKWLDECLDEVGLDRARLVVLNATACIPPQGLKTDANMGQAAKACRPLFDAQYAAFKLLPTLAMGKWAGFAANSGKALSVETGRGFVRYARLILTWHPTYARFYNPWKAGEFVTDLGRFKRLVEGRLERDPTTNIRPSIADVAALAKSKVLAVDIETRAEPGRPAHEGKDPTRAGLRTIALGNTLHGVAYWWGSNLGVQRAIARILADPSVLKIFHNGHFFDLRVLARYGVKVVNVADTKDMRRAVSATSRLSLRYLTSLYSDFAPWKELEADTKEE